MRSFFLLVPMTIGIVAIAFTSCEKDDNSTTVVTDGSSSSYPTSAAFTDYNDPEGTIWLNIDNQQYYHIGDISIRWTEPDNLDIFSGDMVRIGKVSGLNSVIKIKTLPVDGWSDLMACEPGYGYIAANNSNTPSCVAIYVVDHLYGGEAGGICGAKIKYCPFPWPGYENPNDDPNNPNGPGPRR